MLMLKAIIEIAFLYFLGNFKGRTLDYFFHVLHIRHNFPLQTDTHMDELLEILLKLASKTVQVHCITGTTLGILQTSVVKKPIAPLMFQIRIPAVVRCCHSAKGPKLCSLFAVHIRMTQHAQMNMVFTARIMTNFQLECFHSPPLS